MLYSAKIEKHFDSCKKSLPEFLADGTINEDDSRCKKIIFSLMKINSQMKVRKVAGENIVIQQANGTTDMTQVTSLNETALYLYDALKEKNFAIDDIVQVLTEAYDVDEDTARRDATEWVAQMKQQALIID